VSGITSGINRTVDLRNMIFLKGRSTRLAPIFIGDWMPIYSMRNKETQEEFEVTLKFSELDSYLSENTNIQQIFTKFPAMGDSIRLGVRKPDDGFRDVLRNVRHHHKKDNINTF